MREIKFRAWDKIGKEMFRVIMLSFPVGQKKIIVSGRGGSTDTDNDDCILMQFTGLYDQNGKEIYEGDIVNTQYSQKYNKKHIGICKWGQLNKVIGFVFEPITEITKGIKGLWNPQMCELEVIGNIYENPELLK